MVQRQRSSGLEPNKAKIEAKNGLRNYCLILRTLGTGEAEG